MGNFNLLSILKKFHKIEIHLDVKNVWTIIKLKKYYKNI
jgi:hypothetical protein